MRRLLVILLVLACLVAAVVLSRDGGSLRAGKRTVEPPARPEAPAHRAGPEAPRTPHKAPPENHSQRPPTTTLPARPDDVGELRRLRGKVVWDDGQPVANADVHLHSSPFDGFTRYVLRGRGEVRSHQYTNADGKFEVDWAPGGHWALTVYRGTAPGTVVRTPPLRDEITIVLPRRPTVLEVAVVREGDATPVEGATVEASWQGSPYRLIEKSDAEGRVRFDGALPGTADLTVKPEEGEIVADHWVDCVASKVTRTTVRVGRGLTLRGTVVADDSGTPVAGAGVWIGFRFEPQIDGVTTDHQGRFVWGSLPWDPRVRRTISVVADGFAAWQGQIGHPEKDGAEQELAVRLLRPVSIRMRCINANGSPRGGLLVIAETERLDEPERSVHSDLESAYSGADGSVTLSRLAPGDSGTVRVWIQGAVAREIPFAAIRASEVRDLGDIVVHDPRDLTGLVRTARGKPATGAFVVIEKHHDEDTEYAALSSALIAPRFGARVGAEGSFRIRGVQPGSWDLLVYGGGHPRLLRVAIPVRAGQPIFELDLRLPTPVSLRGRVVDASGAGVANLELSYMRSHPVAANLIESARTDADGRFEIPGFTREDEDIPLHAGSVFRKVTPRDGAIEIRLEK